MKKGFTLIELLAVIVILAIIALIATPIVLSIIEETKESAVLRSAEHYLSTVELGVSKKNLTAGGSFGPNTCEIQESGNLLCDGKDTIEVELSGEVPKSGTITFIDGKIVDATLTLSNKTITKTENGKLVLGETAPKACKITQDVDKDGVADTGDMITCSTESFHVISNDGEQISMLARYNLDVGQIYNEYPEEYREIENPTGIQNSDAIGYVDDVNERYGVLAFSTTDYWYDWDTTDGYIVDTNYGSEGREYPFVYGDYKNTNGQQQNIIYPYVEAYEEYLKKENVKSASATLISFEQLIDLGCVEDGYCSEENSWVYTTSYWSGSAGGNDLWNVSSNSILYSGLDGHYCDMRYGVRPVVNISVNEL